jgi:hypothetical protein
LRARTQRRVRNATCSSVYRSGLDTNGERSTPPARPCVTYGRGPDGGEGEARPSDFGKPSEEQVRRTLLSAPHV